VLDSAVRDKKHTKQARLLITSVKFSKIAKFGNAGHPLSAPRTSAAVPTLETIRLQEAIPQLAAMKNSKGTYFHSTCVLPEVGRREELDLVNSAVECLYDFDIAGKLLFHRAQLLAGVHCTPSGTCVSCHSSCYSLPPRIC